MNTLSCPFPDTLDPLSANGFQLTIAKLPGVSFFCQEATLPSIKLPALQVRTPLVTMNFPSDQLEYDPLAVTFMIDAKMNNYAAILGWLEGLGFPETYEQYSSFQQSQAKKGFISSTGQYDFSAGTLIILGPNSRPVREVEFIDLIPTSISSMTFAATNTDVKYIVANATFAYTYFKLK